jgi:hypothetical protein
VYEAAEAQMLTWIVGGFIVWAVGFLFVLALMRMAGDQDVAARREEMFLDPCSDAALLRPLSGC